MAVYIDDSYVPDVSNIDIINRLDGPREITNVIHDIDGTHSLIRDWPPVMSLSMWYAMSCGLSDNFDSENNLLKLVKNVGNPLEEFDDITLFFNGYSAITQLEYGIRRGIEEGTIAEDKLALTYEDRIANSAVLERLRFGQERYYDIPERSEIIDFIESVTPRLFRFYEKLLYKASRDKNVENALINPERWRVPGSLEFITYLYNIGLENHFVTGAVVYEGGGMREEVEDCG